jgi:serine/threonine protein kinase
MDARQRIADRYMLRAVLGEGGMGTVYEGHDELLDRAVAVKQVRIPSDIDEAERPRLRARVLREARAAARLNHPCATTVHDVVDTDDGTYIVMELASGRTLADVVAEQGPVDVQRAAAIGLALVDALEAAHERGIVHRDVKPSNVLLTPSGDTKLTDFGIATLQDEPAVVSSPVVVGSPAFMAPEQAQGASSQAATDLWGLGATLYCALEGTAPFDRGLAAATLTAVVREETPVARRGGELAPLLRQLLDKDPANRPGIRDARRALEAARDPSGTVDSATLPVATLPSNEAEADRDQRPPRTAAPEPPQPARRPQPVAPTLARRVERVGRFTVKLGLVLLVLGVLAIAALVAWVSSLL